MIGQKEKRQAAIQAAIAQNRTGTEIVCDAPSKSAAGSSKPLFRRRRAHAKVRTEEVRDDGDDKVTGNDESSCRERAGETFGRSVAKEAAHGGTPIVSVADHMSLFGRGDKRQKRVVYTSFSDNPHDVLAIQVDETPPSPRDDNDVVLKVLASTVSCNDCLIRKGVLFEIINPTGLPTTPGMDVVGNVIEVGKNVKAFKVGDRVAALVRTGGNARYCNVPESDLVEVPRSCDSVEAVCMVSTFMTAYQCLRRVTNDTFTLNGKRILITGGIEPVGQALIQLSIRAGATEIYATAPEHRHRYLRTVLGAHPLPVDPNSWLDSINGKMDIVFDGTCYDNSNSASAVLNKEGCLVAMGMSALAGREKPSTLGAPFAAYWAKFMGHFMSNSQCYEVWNSFTDNKDAYKLDLEILFHLLRKRFIKPHIAKRVALSEVAEAQESLEKETARGEIVCLPWKKISK